MKFSTWFINCFPRKIILFIVLLITILLILHTSSIPIINQRKTLSTDLQPNIITPTCLRFNNIEILDFILYQHPNRADQYSIYLSGRRLTWRWSNISCFFERSNTTVRGIIDRRSIEPFILCPLPSIERESILKGSSQLVMSFRIYDKQFLFSPNVTIPIYHRNRYNVSIYTMVRNRTAVLVEWIEYHRIIGVEHFYIYDHFSNDNLDNFLRSYLEQQIVTIVRWPYKQHKGHKWNMMQSAAMNHALKNFGPFNRWMGYFDVDEYFQIINPIKVLDKTISLSDFLDRNFPESIYPGGVQLRNCPISCLISQDDLATSRHRLLLEKCRHISRHRDCQIRTKMFIRPQNVPIMQNIHTLQYGVKFVSSSKSSPLAELRHYHYGTILTKVLQNETFDTSMDIFIKELRKRIINYE